MSIDNATPEEWNALRYRRRLDDCDQFEANKLVATPEPPATAPDFVNHPPHYTQGKVECIDALESATVGLVGIEAHCTANAIKYLWRWKFKGGKQDLKKARWYIDRLIGE